MKLEVKKPKWYRKVEKVLSRASEPTTTHSVVEALKQTYGDDLDREAMRQAIRLAEQQAMQQASSATMQQTIHRLQMDSQMASQKLANQFGPQLQYPSKLTPEDTSTSAMIQVLESMARVLTGDPKLTCKDDGLVDFGGYKVGKTKLRKACQDREVFEGILRGMLRHFAAEAVKVMVMVPEPKPEPVVEKPKKKYGGGRRAVLGSKRVEEEEEETVPEPLEATALDYTFFDMGLESAIRAGMVKPPGILWLPKALKS